MFLMYESGVARYSINITGYSSRIIINTHVTVGFYCFLRTGKA